MRWILRSLLLAALLAGSCADPPALPPQTLPPATIASGGALIPEQRAYDVRHYDLTLRVDHEKKSIEGQVVVHAQILERISRFILDLDGRLKVHGVREGDRDLAFTHKDGRIVAELGRPRSGSIQITVSYGGVPREAPKPPWEGGFTWSKTPSGEPWIATSCQGEGADLWWPCKDHPSDKPETMDLRITVAESLIVAANGTLLSDTKHDDGTRTYHWRLANPISNYGVALNIAPYTVLTHDYTSVTGEKIPIFFYVLPEHADQGRKALPGFLKDLRFFEETCGPYAFRNEKYGIVETPHLGMEHQTIIAYGNGFRADAGGYDWLHNHELSHEWWGNLVTCRDWKDMWIHEGIGTYMQALYLEHRDGPEAYRRVMTSSRRRLRNTRAVAPREIQNTKEIYFNPGGGSNNDIYGKGAWVMHALRWLLEDETFFKALRRMAYPDPAKESVTDGSQCRFSDTEEIRAIAERVSGRTLDWFFEIYLRQPKLPELVERLDGGTLTLEWKPPIPVPFPMPVPVQVGEKIHRVEMPGGRLQIPEGESYTIDPHGWLLRQQPAAAPK